MAWRARTWRVVARLGMVVALLAALPGAARAETQVETRVVVTTLHIAGTAQQRVFEAALSAAVDRANRELGIPSFTLTDAPQAGTDGRIDVTAVNDGSQRVISLTASGVDGPGVSATVFAPWDGLLETVLASTLRYLDAARAGFPSGSEATARFIDELPAATIPSPSAQLAQAGAYPYGVTVRPDGNLVMGGSVFAVELDPLFRVVGYPGRSLLEQGNFNYAMQTSSTPAGTLFLRAGSGGGLYRLIEGAPRPQRLPAGVSGPGHFTALRDGSVVVVDSVNRRSVRIAERRPEPIDLHTHENSYIAAIAAGPTGGIWSFDTVGRRITVFTADGTAVDSIMPHLPPEDLAQTTAMAVYEDGSFILLTRTGLWKLRPNGALQWHVPAVPNGEGGSFAQAMGLAVDSERGFVYVADPGRRTIARFLDTSIAEPSGTQARLAAASSVVSEAITSGDGTAEALRNKALIYEELGAAALAENAWQRVLDVDPFNAEAADGLARAEVSRLEARASRLATEMRRILEDVGQESARMTYSQALQAYERIRVLDPARDGIDEAIRSLRRDFEGHDIPREDPRGTLRVTALSVEDLFPSLSSAYRNRPVGSISIENTGAAPLRNVIVELELKRFGDYPVSSEAVASLAPGASTEIPLHVILNTEVFRIEEDLPVQIRLTIRADSVTGPVETSRTTAITLYRRTALTWDDTRKLAAFVTPNEGNVVRFTHALAGAPDVPSTPESGPSPASAPAVQSFSPRISRAARIADGLGLLGINYVEDPDTPISEILGRIGVVDTVRFPRTTLLHRAGDCDDTTVLLSSLYEAAGIPTAVVTTPDHVLLAFDTGEPASRDWLFESDDHAVFEHEGRIWLPIETTVLSEGFTAAWRAASARIRRAGAAATGFVPVSAAWNRFPSLSVPVTELNIMPPARPERLERERVTDTDLERVIYTDAVARVRADADIARGTARVRHLNQLAMLHGRFGHHDRARAVLTSALEIAPEAVASRVNLANLSIAAGDYVEARRVLLPAHDRRPDSVLVNALLAHVELALGDGDEAQGYIDLVRRRAPDLARRYALLDTGSEARAGGPDAGPQLVWAVSEEEL
ncbi:MAG: tetratricopeptide repeat protein [Spirochaetes bacterium]|nr:tetratricopeptide repeat protein [Spirochaetota bacterium]